MESLLLLLLFILMHVVVMVGGVLCFNCVSTETPGCGLDLDLSLLVTSRIKRESPINSTEIEFYRLKNLSTLLDRNKNLNGNNPNNKTSQIFNVIQNSTEGSHLYKERTSNINHLTTKASILERTDVVTDGNNSKLRETFTFATGKRNSNRIQEKNVKEKRRIFFGARDDFLSQGGPVRTRRVNEDIGSSRLLVVECPGDTCLMQRLPMAGGDVFVRTCDVSHVTSGQCHLVTQVLGARLSVVCVCSGDLCNQMGGIRGAASNFIGLEVFKVRLIVMVVMYHAFTIF